MVDSKSLKNIGLDLYYFELNFVQFSCNIIQKHHKSSAFEFVYKLNSIEYNHHTA